MSKHELMLTFIIQCLACFAMFGLIWLIQLVHYPAFKYVSESEFKTFAKFHTDSISFVVIPLMITEATTAALLYYFHFEAPYIAASLYALIAIWLSTFILSVPCHTRLLKGKCDKTIKKLVLTNWIRTSLWTLRTFLLFFALYSHF